MNLVDAANPWLGLASFTEETKAFFHGRDEEVAELARRGHKVERVRVNGGGYQGILIDPATGVLHGGSEARKDGAAVGY